MTESELLSLIVEFSIGLGGFSAITAAFIHQNQSLKTEDVFRIMNMLQMALGPAFIALFALGVLKLSLPIRYASGVFFLYLLCGWLYANLGLHRLTAEQRKVFLPSVVITQLTISALNVLLQFLSCLSVLQWAFMILYGGLVVLLAQAVVPFVRLIIARPGT